MVDCIWEGSVSTDPTVAGNWSTAAVPQAGEDVIFDGTAQDNCVGGDLGAGPAAINTLTITRDCTIDIGADQNDPINFDCAGAGPVDDCGTGTRYLNGVNTTFWNMRGSGTVVIDGIDNDELHIDNSAAIVTVGPIASTPAEFGTIMSVANGTVYFKNVVDQAAAATDLNISGGTVYTYDALDVVTQTGGTWYHEEESTLTVDVRGGTAHYNSNGKIDTEAEVFSGGILTFANNVRGCTVDACKVHGTGQLRDPNGVVTWTAAPEVDGTVADGRVDFGDYKKYTVAAI